MTLEDAMKEIEELLVFCLGTSIQARALTLVPLAGVLYSVTHVVPEKGNTSIGRAEAALYCSAIALLNPLRLRNK